MQGPNFFFTVLFKHTLTQPPTIPTMLPLTRNLQATDKNRTVVLMTMFQFRVHVETKDIRWLIYHGVGNMGKIVIMA